MNGPARQAKRTPTPNVDSPPRKGRHDNERQQMAGQSLVAGGRETAIDVPGLVAQELNRWLHKTTPRLADEYVSEYEPDLQGEARTRRVANLAVDVAVEWSRGDGPAAQVATVYRALARRGLVHRPPAHRPVLSASRHSPRPRGGRPGRRGASRRSSARSGDSGDDSDGEPDAPGTDGRRECEGCSADISHLRKDAKFCGGACKQLAWRGGYTSKPDPDPYLELSGIDLEWLQRRAWQGCRCNGGPVARESGGTVFSRGDSYMLDPDDGACIKCGHPRDWRNWRRAAERPSYIRAGSPETSHLHDTFLAVAI